MRVCVPILFVALNLRMPENSWMDMDFRGYSAMIMKVLNSTK